MSRSLRRTAPVLGLLAVLGGALLPASAGMTTTTATRAPSPLPTLPGTPAQPQETGLRLPSSASRADAARVRAEELRRIWADPASDRVLVNRTTPLRPASYVPPKLEELASGLQLRPTAAAAYRGMEKAAAASGVTLVAISGYRSYTAQQDIHERLVAIHGRAQANRLSAVPGTSEHQTGLAVDIASPSGECTLEACFEHTAEGRWIRENAWRHGFIIRYPQGQTKATGYDYEPWHLRYVGRAAATEMRVRGITVYEEYAELASR